MQSKRAWAVATVALILLTIALGHASAQVESQAASQNLDADNTATFRVRVQNITADSDPLTLFAPGVWTLHSEAAPLFAGGEADREEGLEALAEDGDPTPLAAALLAKGLPAGIFNTPVCADSPSLLSPPEFYEFEVTTSPETPYLSFATMLVQSNDLFLAPVESGIPLFDEDGKPIGLQNVTGKLLLWDAGTEANEEPGVGPHQAPRQSETNAGPPDEVAAVRPVDDEFDYPEIADLVNVYIVRVPMIERDRGRQPTPDPDYTIGEEFQVGDVQWQVLSADHLGHELTNEKGDSQITDERFIQVRFRFLNMGSDPLEFDGGPRDREGVSLRDFQGREYPYFRVPRAGRPDGPPHDYVSRAENCYGKWTWRGWRPYELKPNTPTTCTIIYKVNVDATSFVIIASDLDDGQEGIKRTVELNLPPVPVNTVGKAVRVGDVRWQVLSAEDLGHVLEDDGNREKTKDRFVEVRFQLTNKGSADLGFHGALLRDSQGREYERGRTAFVAEDERCTGGILGPFSLKPNAITTCTSLYEVPGDATGLIFIADDLDGSDDGAEIVALGLSDVMPLRFHFIEEDLQVGDVCWHVLSVKELGRDLSNDEGDSVTAQGRFLQTQFRLLNLSSESLGYDGVTLVDGRGRRFSHFGEHLEFIDEDSECSPVRLPPGPYSLKPNTPTVCTTIHEVAEDAKNFTLLSTDLEGYEAGLILLPDLETTSSAATSVLPGTYEVGTEIAPGIYRGEASKDSFCKWARLNDLNQYPDSIIAMGLHEGPFYVEVQSGDIAFTTECELAPIAHLEPRDPLLTSVPPGMYVVGLDIGPGKYKGEPREKLFCFWQRLSNFRGEENSTVAWDLPGEEYVVEVAPTDFAVEFHCPVEVVE
ncbi:MAG: spondin domain-containing protein [Caldilineaceae bacterium]|nr:spondin domain-containing protein [Caldilineaceae bacterium]